MLASCGSSGPHVTATMGCFAKCVIWAMQPVDNGRLLLYAQTETLSYGCGFTTLTIAAKATPL